MGDSTEQKWWKFDDESLIVYTENVKKLKCKAVPMAEYFKKQGKKPFAVQYKVNMESDDKDRLFEELGLSDKDRVKNKRIPKE